MNAAVPSVVEIDLDAIGYNVRSALKRLPPGVRIIAVVKANAYGHGAEEVAREALSAGAHFLAVAHVQEGEALRRAGLDAPIVVLGPAMAEEMDKAAGLALTPAVFSQDRLWALEKAGERLCRLVDCHLKVDTGMNRIGVRPGEELEALLDVMDACPHVRLAGIFSHLYNADVSREHTRVQYDRFRGAVEQARRRGHTPMTHLSNSAAVFDRFYSEWDAVRLGIAMYGLSPLEGEVDVKPVMAWKTIVAYLHTIHPGETVSYGAEFTATRETVVATLPVGYADGYPRILQGKAQVIIGGVRVPVIGRVCMDQCMADVTDIPRVELGDEVVLLGRQGSQQITAGEFARWCQTIHYEIVTGAGRRSPRRYLHGR